MVKKLIHLIVFCLPCLSFAQVTINVQLPQAGLVQKDQLWNLVLVNNGKDMIETSITIILKENNSGQTVLSANSGRVLLNKGMKMITVQDVHPVQYNTSGSLNNFLPVGNYTVCYRLNRVDHTSGQTVAEECMRINIAPLSPPLLNTPADKAEIENPYPQFSWIPPTPTEMFTDLNYDINVVEVLEGQSASEAIVNNTPLYTSRNLRMLVENYPSSFSKLEQGKKYAWRVRAFNGNEYAAGTDVWMFSLKPDTNKVKVISEPYVSMKNSNEPAGVHFITDNNLLVKYYSYDQQYETTVRFMSADGKLLQEVKQQINYGDNYLKFQLNRSFKKEKVYAVQITDQQNNIYKALFSIKK